MGDSDEEYDRRRARDKFRRERSDYQERRDDRGRRDDWSERDRGGRREYRDYDPRNRRDRYSPVRHDISPPMKRMRRDWEAEPGMTQPAIMTFKQFLSSQDDAIDDQEAVKKYNEYKLEFKRQQINEFFVAHKDEEWFKIKYHPEESTKRQVELADALKRRLEVFMEFYEKQCVHPIRVDHDNAEQIIRFLDAVVIKLEGGTDFDLKALDEPEEEKKDPAPPPPPIPEKKVTNGEDVANAAENNTKPETKEKSKKKAKRRKRSRDSDSEDDKDESSGGSDSESDGEQQEPENDHPFSPTDSPKVKIESPLGEPVSDKEESNLMPAKENSTPPTTDAAKEADEMDVEKVEIKIKQEPIDDTENDIIEKETIAEEPEEPAKTIEEPEVPEAKTDPEPIEEAPIEEPKEPKPRALHKTCSIFLRYLAPSITKQEVEAMCKRFSGFLRVAIADPQPERRFVRRAWVTFERSVNIKEMCWNLNGIRLRENELGAIVNRDLSRRVRSVNGIAAHKHVVRSDIKLAARIIQNLDKVKKLWDEEEAKDIVPRQGFLLVSKNPLLKNITDHLIEEASAEEEELLGTAEQDENKDGEDGCTVERDETIIPVLDRLLLYLRVVHSVDYYNSSEYPSEDEMPNRCGIMHSRGPPPTSKVSQQEINEYITNFEQKSQVFLQVPEKLDEEDCSKLGRKDPEVETEKFIQANTQELSKDKWLCPLSGKKFKGPEFVRKHIFNKHGEKIEEVKKEVEYFNNYLMDPKRPQLPEHPSSRPAGSSGNRTDIHGSMGPGFPGGPFPPPPPPYGFTPRAPGPNFGGYGGQSYGRGPDMYRGGGGFGKRNYQRPRNDPREIIGYHDLDSPQDVDYF